MWEGQDSRSGARRSYAALTTSFALLIVAGIAAIVLWNQAADADRWVAHTIEVRSLNQALLARVQDATLSERGYLITQDPRYHQLFAAAKADIPTLDGRLKALTQDNRATQQRVAVLHQAVQAQVAELDRVVALLQLGHQRDAVAAVRSHLLTDRLERVRTASKTIDAAEAGLLAARESAAGLRRRLLIRTVVFSLGVSIALAVFATVTFRRYLADLAKGQADLTAEMQRREQTEGQLRQSQKMEAVGQLTGGIAHDFNNMLAIVIGNLDLLSRRVEEHEPLRRYVEQALAGAQRAARLTQSLLAFSRQQPLEPRALDINRSVAEMSRLLRSTLGEDVAIETVLAGGLWPAFIDRSQLENALLNLAINARDAMSTGGKLTIETANAFLDEAYARAEGTVKSGQYVLVALTDTGVGMTPELMEKVFDPFFTTKSPGKGTGLGLSQVHGFIRQSGGHVKIYSEVGKGTTIKLYLPRSRSAVDVSPIGEPPPEHAASGAWVLVVEDEAGVRDLTVSALADLGYRTHEAQDGKAALEKLAAAPEIELLLTDVVMPDMTGRMLADQARTMRPDLKVVFMTGYTRNAIVHNGVLDPDARLLSKPFTLSQLASKLGEALSPN